MKILMGLCLQTKYRSLTFNDLYFLIYPIEMKNPAEFISYILGIDVKIDYIYAINQKAGVMKAKTILLAISCLLWMSGGFAQQKNLPNTKPELKSTASSAASPQIAGSGTIFTGSELEGVEGNIYVGSEWPAGILQLRSGKKIENYRFRYDVYADQMQFINGKDTLAFASPSELSSVTFDNRTFIYEPYECTGMLMKGYFELLVPGKAQLLLKRTITYHFAPGTPSKEGAKETYLITETHFLKMDNQPAQKLMCNKKSALTAMADQKEKMDIFLKMTANKVRNSEELKKMVVYYNSLK